jgi:hypothetical protein
VTVRVAAVDVVLVARVELFAVSVTTTRKRLPLSFAKVTTGEYSASIAPAIFE